MCEVSGEGRQLKHILELKYLRFVLDESDKCNAVEELKI